MLASVNETFRGDGPDLGEAVMAHNGGASSVMRLEYRTMMMPLAPSPEVPIELPLLALPPDPVLAAPGTPDEPHEAPPPPMFDPPLD